MVQKLQTDIVINMAGNLARKARQYGNSMSSFAQKNQAAMRIVQQSTMAASRGIDTIGNRSMVAAGVAGAAFNQTFVKTAAQFERYEIMLTRLQGSEEKGKAAMSWIQDLAVSTPYAVNELTESFVKLKALGIDPMDGSMQAVIDQAAILGGTAETIDGIALALGQAWTKGKLQGEEAMQLLERGVPVWDYLVKASKEIGHNNGIGYTAEQLQEMASNGKLGRSAIASLIQEMGRQTNGSAKAMMNSWNGMISNMGDHWSMFQKDVMDSGAFDALKEQLKSVLDELDEMKQDGRYSSLVDDVGEGLVTSFESAAKAATTLKNAGAELIPILKIVGTGASSLADAVGGYDNLAKALAGIYAANKALRLATPLAKGAVGAGSWAINKARQIKGTTKGKGVLNNLADMGATPVYVVNMPNSGLGGDLPVVDKPSDPKNKKNPLKRILKEADTKSLLAAGLKLGAIPFIIEATAPYDRDKSSFKSVSFAPSLLPNHKKDSERPELQNVFNPHLLPNHKQDLNRVDMSNGSLKSALMAIAKVKSVPVHETIKQDEQRNLLSEAVASFARRHTNGDSVTLSNSLSISNQLPLTQKEQTLKVELQVNDDRVKTNFTTLSPMLKVDYDAGIN